MTGLKDRPAASRYARALFDVARRQGLVAEVRRDLSVLLAALRQWPWARSVMGQARFSKALGRSLAGAVPGLTPLTQRFLVLLLEKKRGPILEAVAPLFDRLADRAGGVLRVKAVVPAAWTETDRTRVRQRLESAWRGPVTLDTDTDATLLGGVVFWVGDRRWDYSLRRQMERLKRALLAPAGTPA